MTEAAVDVVIPDAAAPVAAAPPDGVEASGASAAKRVLPEIEHPIGALRRAILDHFLDSEGDQTIAQIIAGVGGTVSRNNVEAAVLREYRRGRLLRVAPGTYRLAPPKRPEPPQPPTADDPAVKVAVMAAGFAWPSGTDRDGIIEAEWFAALKAWHVDPSTWDASRLGPPPDQPNHRIPLPILARFRDRVRKREERRAEAEAAAARQAAADRDLRDQLIAACHGNFVRGPALDDVTSIRAALEVVPLVIVLDAIRSKTEMLIYPKNEPATSWGEERILRAIAERFCRAVLVPNMVAAWSAAGSAPGKATELPSAAKTS